MSALAYAGVVFVLIVLGWIVLAILRLPRPGAGCSRCGLSKSIACWRVDCPYHEDEKEPL